MCGDVLSKVGLREGSVEGKAKELAAEFQNEDNESDVHSPQARLSQGCVSKVKGISKGNLKRHAFIYT